MKYLLILLLISAKCYGQKDSTFIPMDTPYQTGGSIFLPRIDTPVVRYDTTRCIMLVCDTSEWIRNVSWEIGYEKRQVHCCINGYTGNNAIYQPVPYYTHVEYLDEKKKPLPKNIIIWMAK